MNNIISCDWGTSAFRLCLVNLDNLQVITSLKTNQGIAVTHSEWKKSEHQADRFEFFGNYIVKQVKALEQQYGNNLDDCWIVLSGMASSSIGMLELPYQHSPFCTNGSDLVVHTIRSSDRIKNNMLIISGVQTANDVIRGEETILVGCNLPENDTEQLLILPGTHSKHLLVKDGKVITFNTYMTGELFNLLSTKSILSTSVEPNEFAPGVSRTFDNGVEKGATENLTNILFHVRTNQLFKYKSTYENYHYLSGLLIGAELKDIQKRSVSITLVTTPAFENLYTRALSMLSINNVRKVNSDQALINGQAMMYKNLITR